MLLPLFILSVRFGSNSTEVSGCYSTENKCWCQTRHSCDYWNSFICSEQVLVCVLVYVCLLIPSNTNGFASLRTY